MKPLRAVFEPIAEDVCVDLATITDIAIDTDQTLVRHISDRQGRLAIADPVISKFAADLIEAQDQLGVRVTIISGAPLEADKNLREAGLAKLLVHPVEDRGSFFDKVRAGNRTCLVIDDDYLLAMLGHGNVNPHSAKVREYIQRGEYQDAPRLSP